MGQGEERQGETEKGRGEERGRWAGLWVKTLSVPSSHRGLEHRTVSKLDL